MGGEGAQALLDALLVSDICINFREDRQLRPIQSRDVEPCLPSADAAEYIEDIRTDYTILTTLDFIFAKVGYTTAYL